MTHATDLEMESIQPDHRVSIWCDADNGDYLIDAYEDFLIYPMLLSSLDQPQAIISLANNWFATDLDAIWIQRRSIENQARLFGVPLVRAVNLANPVAAARP